MTQHVHSDTFKPQRKHRSPVIALWDDVRIRTYRELNRLRKGVHMKESPQNQTSSCLMPWMLIFICETDKLGITRASYTAIPLGLVLQQHRD